MVALRHSVSLLMLCSFGIICRIRSSTSSWHRGCISPWAELRSAAPSSSSCSRVMMYWLMTRSRSRPKALRVKERARGFYSGKRPAIADVVFDAEQVGAPAVLEDDVWSDLPVFHQVGDQTALQLRLLTEDGLDGYLQFTKLDAPFCVSDDGEKLLLLLSVFVHGAEIGPDSGHSLGRRKKKV